MHKIRLNHLMVLHIYQKEIDRINIQQIANKFLVKKESEKERSP